MRYQNKRSWNLTNPLIFFFLFSLILKTLLYHLLIGIWINRAHMISACPKFATPKDKCAQKRKKVPVVVDNLSSHEVYDFHKVFAPGKVRGIRQRPEIVCMPKHVPWPNIAECELSVLSRQALQKRSASKEELEKQVEAWRKEQNENQKGVDWQFSTQDARTKSKRSHACPLSSPIIFRGCFEICHFNLLSIALVIAKYRNASLVVCSSLSWSLEVLRWNDIHAKVLSTTHRFGSTLNLPWSVRSTMESAHPQWWATQPLRDSPR